MEFVQEPNIPKKTVRSILIDGSIDMSIKKSLQKLGIKAIKTSLCPFVYPAISYHPDIVFHHLGGNRIMYAPATDETTISKLSEEGFFMMQGSTRLSNTYPECIAYNVARIGKVAFHNLKYTDPFLKAQLESMGVELIHVNQGYSKCSISIADEKSIITEDKGIASEAEKLKLDVLLIEPEENILLPGLNKGFIGGSTGLLGKSTWAITGDLSKLKSCNQIIKFLRDKDINIIQLSMGNVIDIGSIIPLIV